MEIVSQKTHHLVRDEHENIIIQNNNILLQNNETHECLLVPVSQEIINEFLNGEVPTAHTEVPSRCEIDCEDDKKLWTRENTLFLINKVKEFDEELSNSVKKNVWLKITQECFKKFPKNLKITNKSCETKWKALKRTYKSILINNNTSGQKRRHWEYFNIMHEILFSKPEIQSLATGSSIKGLQINESASAENTDEKPGPSKLEHESIFSKKRKQKENRADLRHQAKLARMDRFNDLFEKMVDKM